MRRIFQALTLGMMSSVIAYMAQTLAPFPGLQQMATFSALGLLGAWLTTVTLMPWLSTGRHNHQPKLLTLLESMRNHWPTFEQNRVKLALLILLVGVTVAISQMQVSDDIRSLQRRRRRCCKNDANIARLSGAANPGQYFLLHANSAEQLLQREEALLTQLADSGVPLQATAQSMPSLAQQQKNHQLLQDHVYATQGLAQQLSQQLQQPALYDQMLSSFNQAPAPLNPADWQPAADSPLALQWLGLYQGQFYSMVTVLGNVPQHWPETLDSLNVTGVQWVDRPQSLSNILQHYRQAPVVMDSIGLCLCGAVAVYSLWPVGLARDCSTRPGDTDHSGSLTAVRDFSVVIPYAGAVAGAGYWSGCWHLLICQSSQQP